MAGTQPLRRLSAILAADVAGYSRIMEQDERRAVATLKRHRSEVIDPKIAAHSGRIVDTAGDGLLAEFPSVVSAVDCAIEIQRALAGRNKDLQAGERVDFRIGVNLGDILVEDGEIYGDGINVAARLQALAPPGGLCLSGAAYDQLTGKLQLAAEDLGEQQVKNISRPVRVWRWQPVGDAIPPVVSRSVQNIRFCRAPDGVRIAYATSGRGPPLVKTANWMNHLEFDWDSPIWRHWLEGLAQDHMLLRYDERGNGLSDWNVEDISFDAMVSDLEAVVDAAGLQRFSLLGLSQGCAVSVAYAVRHPERVQRLVLYGGYVEGWRSRGSPAEIARREALGTLILEGWGHHNPAFRQVFTSMFVPDGTPDQMRWFNELEQISTSPKNAHRLHQVFGDIDVRALLPQVRVPTLVLHVRNDGVVPFRQSREFASLIPGARLVQLEGRNHIILSHEPAWPRFLSEVRAFLGEEAETP